MILLKPTIEITRLVVLRNNGRVIDISFHNGLNIIAGENSSGKTTIVRFIAFALGAEQIKFNQTALQCQRVLLEVRANDTVVTLDRNISSSAQQPLSIFWGPLERALSSAITEKWQTFPFRRSASKESFSQVLFSLLDMPQLRGETGANITMHQLLRLIYSDQETPAADIFRREAFDSPNTRAAVGNYLLGIDSDRLYELKLQQGDIERQLQDLRSESRAIARTFGRADSEISLDFVEEQINTLTSQFKDLQEQLARLENSADIKNDASASNVDASLRTNLNLLHSELSDLKTKRFRIEAVMADSELFLAEIEERLASLDESMAAESALGAAVFKVCPSCLTPIELTGVKGGCCTLCKEPVDADSAKSQLARMKVELSLQHHESLAIFTRQIDEVEKLSTRIPALESELRQSEMQFERNASRWRSSYELESQRLSRDIGAKQQEIVHAVELRKLASVIRENEHKILGLEERLVRVQGQIEAVTREQNERRMSAHLAVSTRLAGLLQRDLERQAEFKNPYNIEVDFDANRIAIDGQTSFSESSTVYLRIAFHMALLLSSVEMPSFRFPRFVILDGAEDGGMERERSFNLQRWIRDESHACEAAHQIILATSQVCPDLDLPEFVVGRKYSHQRMSISIATNAPLPSLGLQ